jgi:hypothetical protein
MSRKHYREAAEIIARELKDLHYLNSEGVDVKTARDTVRTLASDLAGMFGRDNPAFNRAQFMEACGL